MGMRNLCRVGRVRHPFCVRRQNRCLTRAGEGGSGMADGGGGLGVLVSDTRFANGGKTSVRHGWERVGVGWRTADDG